MDLYQQQLDLEAESLAMGQERYRKMVEDALSGGNGSRVAPVRSLMARSMQAVTSALSLKMAPKRTPGRAHTAIKFLEGIEFHALAHHALRGAFSCLNNTEKGQALMAVAHSIGAAVMEEHRHRRLKETNEQKYKITQKYIKTAAHASTRRKVMNKMGAEVGVGWSTTDQTHVGIFLLDAVLEATNLFKMGLVHRGTTSMRTLEPTEETLQWLADANSRMSMFMPVRLPMIVPPRDWTSPRDGGYLTNIGGRLDMIKTRNKPYLESLEDVDMPVVYEALNAIQRVGWQINTGVLHVALQCWENGIPVGSSMPMHCTKPVPTPPCEPEKLPQLRKDDPVAYRAWAAAAAEVHIENARAVGKRKACADQLNVATRFAQYPAIYFPHQMDFRGRMYPVPINLHPQADDLARGLLQLAEGKVPGERGMHWLAVHIANCFGVDKVSHEDRVRWTKARLPLWREVAADPMTCCDWRNADDPWQALAAIMDYVRCTDDSEAVSNLSIPMDGSCNGLQNFSALLRDPVGGAATNLIPSDKPQDVYGQVAQVVSRIIDRDAAQGNQFAIVLQGKITRKIVKQPVMTLPYGATLSGMRGMIEEALKKNHPALFPKNQLWSACGYLAGITYDAIGQVVVAARQAMEWLQQVAREAAAADYPIRWTAPNGLVVLQDYRQPIAETIRVHIDGVSVRLDVNKDGDKLDRRRQSLAISPNLVHSFDAAHLQGTVMLCLEKGLTGFSFIHDSYGTLAADVDTMHWCLREAFIRQYTPNLLQEFADEVQAQLPGVILPDLPQPSTLDLQEVHKSLYFFS